MVLVSRRAVSFAHVYEIRPKCLTASTMILHTECHGEPRQTLWATAVQSGLKWAVAGSVVNHWAFMWNPSTWAFFPLFFEILPAVFQFSSQKVILLRAQPLSLPSYTLLTAARVLFMKAFITTLYPSTFQTPYRGRQPSEIQIPSSKCLTTELEALRNLTCTPIPCVFPLHHLLHSHLTPSKLDSCQSMN